MKFNTKVPHEKNPITTFMTEAITTLFIQTKSRATNDTIERTTKTMKTNEFKWFSNKRGGNVSVINTKIIPYDK